MAGDFSLIPRRAADVVPVPAPCCSSGEVPVIHSACQIKAVSEQHISLRLGASTNLWSHLMGIEKLGFWLIIFDHGTL